MNVYKRPLFKRQGGSIRVPVPTPPVAMRATPRRMPGSNRRGIGQLMADVAGKVNMESAPGNPNRMGQGLGNIMMARQGGAVQKLANGGSLTEQYYEQNRPFFEKILGTSQEDRDAAQKRFIFDQIVTGGLDLARGAGGQGNFASQVANVFRGAPGAYSNMQAGFDAADDQVNLATLQSADARANAEREQKLRSEAKLAELQEGYNLDSRLAGQELINQSILEGQKNAYSVASAALEAEAKVTAEELSAKAEVEGRQADIQQYFSSDGTVLSGPFDMSDPAQRADALELGKTLPALNAALMPAKDVDAFAPRPDAPSAANIIGLGFPDGRRETFDPSTPEGSAAYQEALKTEGVFELDLKAPGALQMTPAFASGFLATDSIRAGVETAKISNEDLAIANRAIQMNTKMVPVSRINPDTAMVETNYVPTKLEKPWEDAIIAGYNLGLDINVPKYLEERLGTPPSVTSPPGPEVIPEESLDGTLQSVPGGSVVSPAATDFTPADQEVINKIPKIPDATTGAVDSTFVDWNPADSFGTQAQADAFINRVVPKVINFFTGLEYGAGSPEEIRAESALNSINAFILETLFSSGADGDKRMGQDERELFYPLVPGPGEPAERAAGKYEDFVREFTRRIDNKKAELALPQGSFTAQQKIRQQIVGLESRRQQIAEVAAAIRSGISGRGNVSETDLQAMEEQYLRGRPVTR